MTRLLTGWLIAVLLCTAGAAAAAAKPPPPPPAASSEALPPPPPPPPPVPAPASGTECFPTCRTGFFCHQGQCVSACNPPCGPSEQCTSTGQCIVGSAPYAPEVQQAAEGTERAPPGFHYEQRRRKGMMIAGIATFGAGYLVAVIYGTYASVTSSAYLYSGSYNALYFLPLAGPLLRQLAVTGAYGGTTYYTYTYATDWLLAVASTAAQVVGFTLALLGLRTVSELVRDGEVSADQSPALRWTLAPGAGGAPLGLTLLLQN